MRAEARLQGSQVQFTGSFYANTGLVILDAAKVKIGTRVLCGPRVGIYSATHSSEPLFQWQANKAEKQPT